MAYRQFKTPDGQVFGSFQTFQVAYEGTGPTRTELPYEDASAPGWYWQACYPGCLPDGEPVGPFESERAAVEDASDID